MFESGEVGYRFRDGVERVVSVEMSVGCVCDRISYLFGEIIILGSVDYYYEFFLVECVFVDVVCVCLFFVVLFVSRDGEVEEICFCCFFVCF